MRRLLLLGLALTALACQENTPSVLIELVMELRETVAVRDEAALLSRITAADQERWGESEVYRHDTWALLNDGSLAGEPSLVPQASQDSREHARVIVGKDRAFPFWDFVREPGGEWELDLEQTLASVELYYQDAMLLARQCRSRQTAFMTEEQRYMKCNEFGGAPGRRPNTKVQTELGKVVELHAPGSWGWLEEYREEGYLDGYIITVVDPYGACVKLSESGSRLLGCDPASVQPD